MRHPDENKKTPLPAAASLSLSFSFLWFAINFWTWLKTHSRILYFLFFCIGPDDMSRWCFFGFSRHICFSRVRLTEPLYFCWPILIVTADDFDSRVAVYMGPGHESVFSSPRDGEVNFSVPPNFLLEGRTFFVFIFIYAFGFWSSPFRSFVRSFVIPLKSFSIFFPNAILRAFGW